MLLAHALERPRSYLMAHPEEQILDCDATDRYESQLARRAGGEPMAYILGEKEFWSLPLRVRPAVLVPRPETELLVERALTHLPPGAGPKVLDLGTGSGAIALALASERADCRILGTDVSENSVELARENALLTALGNVEFRAGNWYEPARQQRFDLIVCNPPYIADDDPRVEPAVRRFEPHAALFAGADGLDALKKVISGAGDCLLPRGWLLVEHGDRQAAAVREYMRRTGFIAVTTSRDLAGLERCTEARFEPPPSTDA